MKTILSVFLAMVLLAATSASAQIFPGAEGYGANITVGANAATATVIRVTKLVDDNSVGTLREALTRSGKRIVVPCVSGVITSQAGDITNANRDLLYLGHLAPGEGLIFTGGGFTNAAPNVVMISPGCFTGDGDGFNLTNPDDRASLFWTSGAADSFYIAFPTTGPATDVTFKAIATSGQIQVGTVSWGIFPGCFAASLHAGGGHAMCMTLWGVDDVSVLHSLLLNMLGRGPRLVNNGDVEFSNNIIYNYQSSAPTNMVTTGGRYNLTGNLYIAGPQTSGPPKEVSVSSGAPTIYMKRNKGPNRTSDTGSEWLLTAAAEGTYRNFVEPTIGLKREFNAFDGSLKDAIIRYAGRTQRSSLERGYVNQLKGNSGSTKDAVSAGNKYWPRGKAKSVSGFTITSTRFTLDPVGGTILTDPTSGTWAGRSIQVDHDADGDWTDDSTETRTINGSGIVVNDVVQGTNDSITVTVTSAWTFTVTTADSYRVVLTTSSGNAMGGYPTIASVSPPNDVDTDGLPDYVEKFMSGSNSDSTSITATADADGDGLINIWDWARELIPNPVK